ncbi:very short patch repair endonuclease [Bradyrhizobium sp. USDA 3256]
MPDNLDAEQRRRTMQSIGSKNTRSELRTRRYLHARGFRFRLHDKSLPGKPDIVLKRYKTVIFVNGCFWHQHGCSRSAVPKTNRTYWVPKLRANVMRHETQIIQLRESGWTVIVVWECDTISNDKLRMRLRPLIRRRNTSRSNLDQVAS